MCVQCVCVCKRQIKRGSDPPFLLGSFLLSSFRVTVWSSEKEKVTPQCSPHTHPTTEHPLSWLLKEASKYRFCFAKWCAFWNIGQTERQKALPHKGPCCFFGMLHWSPSTSVKTVSQLLEMLFPVICTTVWLHKSYLWSVLEHSNYASTRNSTTSAWRLLVSPHVIAGQTA